MRPSRRLKIDDYRPTTTTVLAVSCCRMSLYESLIRPLAFRADPERAHNLAVWLISHGLVRTAPCEDPRLRQTLFGVDFPNPLGLAAGFDKNAIAVNHWHKL